MANILNVLLKTIEDAQQKNQKNPNEETADPSIFDLLKNEVAKLGNKVDSNSVQKGRRNPKSILDMIKDGIEGVRKQNRKDPKVKTAPKSVFDNILRKVEAAPQRQASTGLKKIVEDYQLDISTLPREMVGQIQQKYQQDVHSMNKEYATAIFNLLKQRR